MDLKQLVIRGISYSQTQSGAYALLLEHEETNVKLPVVIGNFEAQSISLGLEKDIHPPRPLTHDLFAKFITDTKHSIASVIIYQIVDGVFFSNINLLNEETGQAVVLDARTSDAVAMAVRFDAPIFTTEEVLSEAGILLEIEEKQSEDPEFSDLVADQSLTSLSMDDLQKLLEDAVKDEDFDTAMEIQEEIKRRKKKIE
ncbi:bifunctional nuclease family protein [Kaistella sp. PBT33-4]|uniref:bifunctional nuclease family protein n=1 Tax=Kaistella sp. PBT33-4 TaxID=3032000 RepID=UPI0023D89367|nr:bifunctional nuclease family protein [Kaistella sp. PBT33-4]MDF0719643.1 bifunctional nuclease family protein [Kaistella sp. PBT33-4]